jgi:hypothetical protein
VLFVIVILGVWAIAPASLSAPAWSRPAGPDPRRRGLGRVMASSAENPQRAPNLASRDLRELYVEVERDAREFWKMCPSWRERSIAGPRDVAQSSPSGIPDGGTDRHFPGDAH